MYGGIGADASHDAAHMTTGSAARKGDLPMFVRVRARASGAFVLVCTLLFVLVVAITPTGAAPLNTDAELKIVKAGYEAIRAHLYTDPDTALLLTNAQDEARKALDQP